MRRVFDLLLKSLVILIAGSVEGADSWRCALGRGMVLNDVIIPISPSSSTNDEPVVLSARVARTLDSTHLLSLEGVKSVFCIGSGNYSSVYAENALLDSLSNRIVNLHDTDFCLDVSKTPNRDHEVSVDSRDADSKSFRPKASNLALDAMIDDVIAASGSLFVNVKAFQTSVLLPNDEVAAHTDNDFFAVQRPSEHIICEFPTRLKLVQEACVSLAHFYKCWPLANGTQTHRMGCFSKNGGRLANLEKGVMINGPAVILSEPIVLNAADGIFLRRGISDDHEEIETHVSADNGVRSALYTEKGDVTIECRSFKYVTERKVAQFEGGPVVMRRNHVTLVAEEEWQFVRVFDCRRVVLSPGKWTVVGSIESQKKNFNR